LGHAGDRRISGEHRSLRAALRLILAVAVVITAMQVAVLLAAIDSFTAGEVFYVLVGTANVVVGVALWSRRPANGTGMLLAVVGFFIFAAAAQNLGNRPLAAFGLMLGEAPIGAVAHLLLAFPRGRLRSRAAAALVAGGYVVTVGLQIPQYVFSPDPVVLPSLRIASRPDVVHAVHLVQRWTGAALLAAAAALMLTWLLRTTRPATRERRILAAVYGYGILVILFYPLSVALGPPIFGLSPYGIFIAQVVATLTVPFVFAFGALAGGFARTGAIHDLAASLETTDKTWPILRAALARTLGDESLQLAFAVDGAPAFVDQDGRPIDAGPPAAPRAAVVISGSGGPVGEIIYDTEMIADPDSVEAAARVVALALERERLTTELLASREALLESRARVVEVAEAERRQVAQDLHDLIQSRLVLAGLLAGRLVAGQHGDDEQRRELAVRLRGELDAAVTELRRQLHGLMPAVLLERGLTAAVADLVDRVPVPTDLRLDPQVPALPPSVASTGYYIVAEALANAVKHAGASVLHVSIDRDDGHLLIQVRDDGRGGATLTGSGLRGMIDRVETMKGQLELDSQHGQGTHIRVQLPCES
jgi:signal transduction histidine kinase